ncbi:MAG TPA: glycosyltransferase, partial [Tianweitania sediminis]|nr:glycosyltransferase [Tianweitania sediminis]
MTPSEKVTIGITCYNARDTIARAVASALAQDWDDLEVLIADDASTD